MDTDKQKIIDLFNLKVRGKTPTPTGNARHDGRYGHWLEEQMGIPPNASNTPDIFGYEMKNDTAKKTTFGDWSADYYIFKGKDSGIDRDGFLAIFGKPNMEKNGRLSWSGEPCPSVGKVNRFGQELIIDNENNIIAVYCYSKDRRLDKGSIVPAHYQKNDLILARWDAGSLKEKLERKFNNKGCFKCKLNAQGVYATIVFGKPINYEDWIEFVRKGIVFFDSGMYQGNIRPYSQWRANNKFWDAWLDEEY